MRRLALVVLALVLMTTACAGVSRRVLVIDLRDQTAEFTWVLVGTEPDDLDTIVEDYVDGDTLESQHPGWTVTRKELVPVGDELHGVVGFAWTRLTDVGVSRSPYAGTRYRYCPASTERIVASNANARTTTGCVLWHRWARVLRVELVSEPRPEGQSLRSWFRPPGSE